MMTERYFDKLYVDGQWIEVENPFTQEIIARVPLGDAGDVDKAGLARPAALFCIGQPYHCQRVWR